MTAGAAAFGGARPARFWAVTLRAPFGPVRVTEGCAGLISIELIPAGLPALAARLRPVCEATPELAEVKSHASAEALAGYFAGRCQAFSLPIDWSLSTGFLRTVLVQLSSVPFGVITSYAALARAAGSAAGARAVGAAMAKNPLPIVVPCHRVLAAGGRLGGFTGGLPIKRWLLEHEGLSISSTGSVGPASRQLPLLG